MKKRIFSFCMAMVMLYAMLPVHTLASQDDGDTIYAEGTRDLWLPLGENPDLKTEADCQWVQTGQSKQEQLQICQQQSHVHTPVCQSSDGVYSCTHHTAHTESCRMTEYPQCPPVHAHSESCGTAPVYSCHLEESAGHVHQDTCFELDCGMEAGAGAHTHSVETCSHTMERTCGVTQEHTHSEGCYTPSTCQQEHDHTDTCSAPVLSCGFSAEHSHTDSCLSPDFSGCPTAESAGHAHTEVCRKLICGLDAGAGSHSHSDSGCAVESTVYLCGFAQEHTHSDGCPTRTSLVCGYETLETHITEGCAPDCSLVPHTHSEACYEMVTLYEWAVAAKPRYKVIYQWKLLTDGDVYTDLPAVPGVTLPESTEVPQDTLLTLSTCPKAGETRIDSEKGLAYTFQGWAVCSNTSEFVLTASDQGVTAISGENFPVTGDTWINGSWTVRELEPADAYITIRKTFHVDQDGDGEYEQSEAPEGLGDLQFRIGSGEDAQILKYEDLENTQVEVLQYETPMVITEENMDIPGYTRTTVSRLITGGSEDAAAEGDETITLELTPVYDTAEQSQHLGTVVYENYYTKDTSSYDLTIAASVDRYLNGTKQSDSFRMPGYSEPTEFTFSIILTDPNGESSQIQRTIDLGDQSTSNDIITVSVPAGYSYLVTENTGPFHGSLYNSAGSNMTEDEEVYAVNSFYYYSADLDHSNDNTHLRNTLCFDLTTVDQDCTPLSGTTFVLAGSADTLSAATGSSHHFCFRQPGTYYLKQTGAPKGYTPDSTRYKLVVNRSFTTRQISLDGTSVTAIVEQLQLDATNSQLPVQAEDSFLVVNQMKFVNVKVTKRWIVVGNILRPSSVKIGLYANGEHVDTVVLSARNKWTHTWKDLPATVDYTVDEIDLAPGFHKRIRQTLTNKWTITNSAYTIPKTGDDFDLTFWLAALGTTGTLLTGAVYLLLKKQRKA